ncbi:MAG: hypothetical protein RLZ22_356 [Verrucomicrobiota bacterium]|jgi:hypothetical protein
MFRRVLLVITLPLLCLNAMAQAPDPSAILEGARLSASLTKLEKGLSGHIRKGNQKTPVTLFLMGGEIQFQFFENPSSPRIFHMRMGDSSYNLFEIVDGKTCDLNAKQLVAPIAGTDLTYEDLSLRFLYWPNPKLEGSENIGGQACHKIRIDKPRNTPGRYEVVYVWVHEKFGAFMKIRGHDEKGGLLKEFQVEDIMQVANNVWTLRKMQVSSHDPQSGRRTSITDVTFESPNQVKPRGLR